MRSIRVCNILYWTFWQLDHFFRYSWLRLLIIIPEIVLSSLLSICVENVAVCTMWFGDWYDFYIVQKEVDDVGDAEKRLVQTV